MKVFKFGGASVSSIERIQDLPSIIRAFSGERLLIVISAMGKTTNALEKVAEAFYSGDRELALQLFAKIKSDHIEIANALMRGTESDLLSNLVNFFTEVEWLLHDKPVREYDYYYDQIVCIGELLSTCIIAAYFNCEKVECEWVDVRDILRTDNNYRDAAIDWEFSSEKVRDEILPVFERSNIIVTQGFIGSTSENESTTLGREGSDYTAAVFANMLEAQDLTIWKDVEGVMNADPKLFTDAQIIPELSYEEVIEMAYYGAQVIHPKTIKPLQNKSIPLLVKCFFDINIPGTVIHNRSVRDLPPIIVMKRNQAMIRLHSRDFSFVGEKPMSDLYALFEEIRIKPNLIQSGAVSILFCIDDKPEKIERLALEASGEFNVEVEKDLSLLTVRHHRNDLIETLLQNSVAVLKQETPDMVQVLFRK